MTDLILKSHWLETVETERCVSTYVWIFSSWVQTLVVRYMDMCCSCVHLIVILWPWPTFKILAVAGRLNSAGFAWWLHIFIRSDWFLGLGLSFRGDQASVLGIMWSQNTGIFLDTAWVGCFKFCMKVSVELYQDVPVMTLTLIQAQSSSGNKTESLFLYRFLSDWVQTLCLHIKYIYKDKIMYKHASDKNVLLNFNGQDLRLGKILFMASFLHNYS